MGENVLVCNWFIFDRRGMFHKVDVIVCATGQPKC